jgi:hypothetical protein
MWRRQTHRKPASHPGNATSSLVPRSRVLGWRWRISSGSFLLTRRARNASGTATQCTRRNDSHPPGLCAQGLGGLRSQLLHPRLPHPNASAQASPSLVKPTNTARAEGGGGGGPVIYAEDKGEGRARAAARGWVRGWVLTAVAWSAQCLRRSCASAASCRFSSATALRACAASRRERRTASARCARSAADAVAEAQAAAAYPRPWRLNIS